MVKLTSQTVLIHKREQRYSWQLQISYILQNKKVLMLFQTCVCSCFPSTPFFLSSQRKKSKSLRAKHTPGGDQSPSAFSPAQFWILKSEKWPSLSQEDYTPVLLRPAEGLPARPRSPMALSVRSSHTYISSTKGDFGRKVQFKRGR